MFRITVQASEKANSKQETYQMTLKDMDVIFQTCEKGSKLGKGFIRGALMQPGRCDEHLEYSKLLIVDADGGLNGNPTPSVDSCHDALCALGYNHIIYTTHSHKPEYHKYRAIIELSEEIESHELHENMSQLIQELRANGCPLKYAHEMDTWSQIWFLPRADEPELFQHRAYFEGAEFRTIHIDASQVQVKSRESSEYKSSGDKETLDEMFENIRTGKEFHQSLRNISYQLIKDGVSKALTLSTLRSLMESSTEAGTDRWLQRMKDLERLIDGAIQRVSDEEAEQFEIPQVEKATPKYTPPPLPPGRLGRAIKQCLASMARPQIEFAFPMILGSISAICGARWNARTNEFSGLNLAMTVVADTGFGKGQISKFYNNLFIGGLDGRIINLSGGEGAMSFIGANNYTAPKPLHNDLLKGRSKIVCMQEAGIMLGAKSGNADELSAYVMENYVNSAYNQFASSRAYSSDDNSLKPFRAPAISLVLESTEESLAASLKDMNALESGFIPRQTMFKINDKPKMNRNRDSKAHYEFDDDVVKQFKDLIREGCQTQVVEVFEPLVVEWSDEQFEDYCDLVDHYNSEYRDDKVSKIIASRMAHKVVKFAALCSIFNTWQKGNIMLDEESWNWAKEMGQWEMNNIDHNLSYMKTENVYDAVDEIIKERIHCALHHKDTSDKQRKAKVVKVATIVHRCNTNIERIAMQNKMSKADFIFRRLRSMERMGFLRILDGHPSVSKGKQCIQILEGMFDDL